MRPILAVLLVCSLAFGQTATNSTNPTPSATTQAPNPPMAFGLEGGTPVKLRLSRTISSATEKTGDTIDFEVLDQVKVGETVVIPIGSIAWGTVTEAEHKKRMGRGGKLNVNIDHVKLKDGTKAALRAAKENKGGGHVGAMTGAMVATAVVFFPAAPLFLFMHGKDITIPKGTEITAYINGNLPLERAAFEPKKPEPVVVAAATALAISSTPDAADIEIDGSFVGNTPATVNVTDGDHTAVVHKKGFVEWQRRLKASGGNVRLNAELENIADKASDVQAPPAAASTTMPTPADTTATSTPKHE
jgi:hypothetical protein